MKKRNYLDYIPIKNSEFKWNNGDDGMVVVEVIRKGIFDRIAQIIFKVPQKSKIKLDERGSFVWNCIDNYRDIGKIADEVKERFDDSEEIMYERLIKFISILEENKFISLKYKNTVDKHNDKLNNV